MPPLTKNGKITEQDSLRTMTFTQLVSLASERVWLCMLASQTTQPPVKYHTVQKKKKQQPENRKCTPFPTATESSLQTKKKLPMPTSFISVKNCSSGSDFPFLCVAVFFCVCVWLFGLAGGERAAGVELSGPDLVFTLFSSWSKGGSDLPNTKSEIIVHHLQSDRMNVLFFFCTKW